MTNVKFTLEESSISQILAAILAVIGLFVGFTNLLIGIILILCALDIRVSWK